MRQQQLDTTSSVKGRWLWLVLLMLAGILNYVDRLSIAVLQVPIKAELGLSDTQLGILTGLSFAMVYTFAVIPIAGFADRYSRKLIIILAVVTWSLMTLMCGFATSFLTICIFRMGVAIGEAGCNPSALAIIADSFSRKDRPRAIAIWHYAFPIGLMIGMGATGLALQLIGWRNTFFLLGSAGLLLAPVLWLWLKDPRPTNGSQDEPPKNFLRQAASAWSSPAFRLNIWAGALLSYGYQTLLNWSPPFYNRAFGMPIHEAAGYLSLIIGIGGVTGVTLATLLASLPGRHDVRWHFWLPAITSSLFAVALLVQCQARDAQISLWAGVLPFIVFNAGVPIWIACGQLLVKPTERAMAAGLQTFVAGIVGSAGGPFLTGVLSDLFATQLDSSAEGLRWAMSFSVLPVIGAAALFLLGARKILDEVPNVSPKSPGDDSAHSAAV